METDMTDQTRFLPPRVPNYLSVMWRGVLVDVADISDAELEKVGEAWTRNLLAHAVKRRKASQ